MNPKSFLSGLEEVVARLLSLFISLVFFVIYLIAREQIILDWQGSVQFLVLFWLVYETIAFVLFVIFRYFGDRRPPNAGVEVPVEEGIQNRSPVEDMPKNAEPVASSQ